MSTIRRRSGRRSGFVYLAVMIVAVVLLIGIFVYHQVMRTGRTATYRSLHADYAGNLATAGLTIAQGWIAQELRNPDARRAPEGGVEVVEFR